MGYNASVLSTATASYPAIGGALATLGWHYPFALPLVAVPIGLLVLFSLHNPEPSSDQGLREYVGNVWKHVKDRKVSGLFAGSLVTFVIPYGAHLTYLPILMDSSFGASPLVAGVIVSSASVFSALVSTQLGRLTSVLRAETLVKTSFVLYAAALCLVPVVPAVWLLLVPTAIFGIAEGINIPNILGLLTGSAPEENRGAEMSVKV